MTWSAPMTAVAGATFSAAQFNTYVRDNLNETAPAKATAGGQLFVSTGPNAIAARTPTAATVVTSQTTASTSYTNLATAGPAVTVTTGTQAIALFKASISNDTSNSSSVTAVQVSGASSQAASDNNSLIVDGVTAANSVDVGTFHLFTGLTSGSNIFTMVYKVGSNTGTFARRELLVIPL
jgi:hypothetical protein